VHLVRDALPDAERRPLVIGVGNADRGDDAAGLLAARRLGGIELEGDPSALLDLLDRVDEAVVIDAVRSGAAPGTVHRFEVGAEPVATLPRGASTHLIGLADALELARVLGRLPARATVHGIEGGRFALGDAMSPQVAAAVERVVAELGG
jgi:hydrogenase maturation protease